MKSHAERTGAWPAWRGKALARIREGLAAVRTGALPRKAGSASPARANHSELVRIFLWEKDVEAAWREAKAGGCADDLWFDLAIKRETEHPEDALPILMVRLGRGDEFLSYLESVRLAHKPKRNFMKLLDAEKWR